MKKILFFLLLSIISYNVFAQAPSKKCPTCGQSMGKCQYKGKHPKQAPVQKSQSTISVSSPTGYINGHGYVDLGLKSGRMWAYCNVGANQPYQSGEYYAYGEIKPKNKYTKDNWKKKPFRKGQKQLDNDYDVAYVNWGQHWQIPSDDDFYDLVTKCKASWGTINGQIGIKFEGPNGNSIFLPAAGTRNGSNISRKNIDGVYIARDITVSDNPYFLGFSKGIEDISVSAGFEDAYIGFSIRPVLQEQ